MQNSLIRIPLRRVIRAGAAVFLTALFAGVCIAAELHHTTIVAFNHYVEVAERQMKATLHPDGPFLWIDSRSESTRKRYYEQLRSGQFVIHQLHIYEDGHPMDIPDGMIHHWVGIAFVPGATMKSAKAVFEDYQDYARIYAPQVRRSKILSRNDGDFTIYMQLYKDSPRQVAYNAEFDVQRMTLSPTRVASNSISTRIAQLQDASQPDSAEMPVGEDSGYLWRMNNYWRYEQKDGGVYLQVEAISLSRDVPAILSWFINPIIHRVARETLASLLTANRRAIEDPGKYAPGAFPAPAASGSPAAASPASVSSHAR